MTFKSYLQTPINFFLGNLSVLNICFSIVAPKFSKEFLWKRERHTQRERGGGREREPFPTQMHGLDFYFFPWCGREDMCGHICMHIFDFISSFHSHFEIPNLCDGHEQQVVLSTHHDFLWRELCPLHSTKLSLAPTLLL